MNVILYTQNDYLNIVIPLDDIEIVMKKDIPPNVKPKLINASILPKDMTFRDAWVFKETYIDIDIEKARDVWRNHIRIARELAFEENDKLLRDAILENDDEKRKRGLSIRDALRNATRLPEIDSAQTVDELRRIWPEVLGKNPFC